MGGFVLYQRARAPSFAITDLETGDRYLRRILVVGTHAVLKRARRPGDVSVAHTASRPQTIQGGGGGTCQQDGAHRLGAAGLGRHLSGACAYGGDVRSPAAMEEVRTRTARRSRPFRINVVSPIGKTPDGSRTRSNSVAFGLKRTFSEPRSQNRIYVCVRYASEAGR
jgi:hypothetical protein